MKNKTALKGGTYSIVLTTIVLAILVVVNIFAQALPSSVFTGSYRMVKKTMSWKSFWTNMIHYLIILK